MRNTVARLGARVGIAALAALPLFMVSAGAATAAPSLAVVHSASAGAPTAEECTIIRQTIEGLKSQRRIAQAELAHATPAQRPGIIAEIRELTAEIAELATKLRSCPAQV